MSKITEGEVEVLGEFVLKQSLNAATQIDRRFGSVRAAMEAVRDVNIDALCFIISAGSGAKIGPSVQKRVWQNRLDLAEPIMGYLAMVLNGGKPLPDADEEAEDGEKNAES